MTRCLSDAPSACGINPERLDALLAAFPGRRILVAGDLILDEYVWGQANRVSPEAPVLVLDVERTSHSLGGAANVAQCIQVLGGTVTIAGVVGADPAGKTLLEAMQDCDCSVDGVLVAAERRTTVKTRVVAHHQQIVRVDRETREAIGEPVVDRLLTLVKARLPAVDAVVLSDYAKGVLTDRLVAAIVREAKKHGKPLVANLKPPRIEPFRGASLLTLNVHEAERAARQTITDESSLHQCGESLRRGLACDALLITRGADGMTLYTGTQEPMSLPTRRVQVFDVTGAGDAVVSAAAMALACGASYAEAVGVGNLAGNIKVTKLGAAAIDREEMRQFVATSFSEASSDEITNHARARLRAAA